MRPLTLLLSVSTLTLLPSTLSAQAKPTFAAKWTMVVDTTSATSAQAPTRGRRGGRGGGGGARGGMGTEMTIAQDAKVLTITRTTRGGENKHTYNLDGSESRNTMTGGRGGGSVEQVSTAKWDANRLVITTTTSTFNGNPIESTMTLSLDPSGNLVVETTGGGRGGGTQVTTKTSYKKAS